jgi:tetratricopeptide (TPR) repeat protein
MAKANRGERSRDKRPPSRWSLLVGLLALVTLVGGVGSLLVMRSQPPTEPSASTPTPGPEPPESLIETQKQRTAEELAQEAERTGDLTLFERALSLSPDNPDLHYRYGMILTLTDREAAMEQLSRTLQIDPKHLDALQTLGDLLLEGKKYASAARRYEKALQVLEERLAEAEANESERARYSERRLQIIINLGRAYVGWAGQLIEGSEDPKLHQKALSILEKAEPLLKEALKGQPKRQKILMALGDLYAYRGEYDEAIAHYKRVLERFPHNLETLVKIGQAYFKSGDLVSAERAFSEAWERSPALGPAALGLGDVYRAQGRTSEALGIYRAGFRKAPDRPFAPKEQLALRVLELAPSDVETRRWLADQYRQIRRYVNAIEHYEELLRWAGDQPEMVLAAYAGLGEGWLGMAEYAKSKEFLRRALALVPQVLQGERATEEKIRLYELLLKADQNFVGFGRLLTPDGMEALFELTKLYLERGKLVAAKVKLMVLQQDYPFYRPQEVAQLAEELAQREKEAQGEN